MTTPPLPKYLSKPSRCRAVGWALVAGMYISTAPMVDEESGLLASLTYRGALEAAAHFEGRLPNRAELIELDRVGFLLSPVTLPATTDMDSVEWERRHTEAIRKQLLERGWDGVSPLVNCGKHWLGGAPPGRAYLMGWDPDGAGPLPFIQSGLSTGQGPHNDMHHDYGTTTMIVRSSPLPPDPVALALLLGQVTPPPAPELAA